MLKQQKGITLIALVVTIIVLLILAGITIATLMGENGIIGNSQEAKTHNAYAQAREQMELGYMAVRTEIAMQTAKDGTYSPVQNVANLASVVSAEINGTGWNVVASTPSTGDTEATITITRTDTAIDAGVIDSGSPRYEGKVIGVITVKDQVAKTATEAAKTQSAEFDFDVEE